MLIVCRSRLNNIWKNTNTTRWLKIFASRPSIVYSKREDVVVETSIKRRRCARLNKDKRYASNCQRTKEKSDAFTNRIFIKLFLTKWKQSWNSYQTKNRRKFCETLLKNISFKKIKLHKDLSKLKNSFITHMKTERIKLIDYLFFRRVFIVLISSCSCENSRQTLRHVLLFCSNWFEKRSRILRNDDTTNTKKLLNSSKNLKTAINWLIKINLLTQFSLIKEYLD